MNQIVVKPEEKEHSDLVGGSIARRRLHCPGSYRLSNQIPAAVRNKSSPYADEGTACHYVIEQILNKDDSDPIDWLDVTIKLPNMTDAIVMTKALIEEAIQPCIDLFDELDRKYASEGGLQYMVEARCAFPGVPGAFGTTDILAKTEKRTIILDWKFGVGVAVKAIYNPVYHDDGRLKFAENNEQLMFYATAARHTYPKMFGPDANWWVELYIAQPRSRDLEPGDPIYSHTRVMNSDLDAFAKRLQDHLPKIEANDAPVSPGDWCKFCPAVPLCPAKMNPAFEIAKLAEKYNWDTQKLKLPPVELPLKWGDVYKKLLDFSFVAEEVAHALQEQAHAYMEEGGIIPDYKLVAKRPTERYVDEKGAARHVIGMGVDSEEIYTDPVLKSPAQLATVMEPHMAGRTKKERIANARAELEAFTEKISSGTTLVHEGDSRESVKTFQQTLQQLAETLKLSHAQK